jgi:hypothetical protein
MESVLDWVMRHELDEAGILLEQEQASRLAFESLVGLLNTEERERASISALQACRARRSSRPAHRWRRAHRGVTAARRPRATDDQRRRPPHDLDRLAVGVLLVSFAEEQAAARGSRQAAQ